MMNECPNSLVIDYYPYYPTKPKKEKFNPIIILTITKYKRP